MDDSLRLRESGPSFNTADEAALVNVHGPETGVHERARAARSVRERFPKNKMNNETTPHLDLHAQQLFI